MNKIKRQFIEWAKKNPESIRQHIRDLYDKIFPTAQEYIKFLRNGWQSQKSILDIGMILKDQKHKEEITYWNERANTLEEDIKNDRFGEKDRWEGITAKQQNQYKKLIEQWLNTKTNRQRTIWNYYILGVPKKRIVTLMKKDSKYIQVTINKLQTDFLKKIPTY